MIYQSGSIPSNNWKDAPGKNFSNTIKKALTETEKTKLEYIKVKNFLFIKRHHKENEKIGTE